MPDRLARRRFLRAGVAAASIGIVGCSEGPVDDPSPTADASPADQDPAGGSPTASPAETTDDETTPTATPESGSEIGLETVATGFTAPVGFEVPPDGNDRRYVIDQYGRMTVLGPDGLRETVLDVSDRLVDLSGYEERGLLGVAFHPEFGSNRRVFVRYSAPSRGGTPNGYSHTFVLAEFEASDDGPSIDRDTERTVLEIPQPQSNHNAGAIAFGPDGYLYVAVGDGGRAGDTGRGHVDDWYDENEGGNGQDVTENLLGSVLRIDVDGAEGERSYAIPDDNPLVGDEGREEQYAWGFRNPWRLSFDDGRLLVADVGQDRYEEVNVVERGGNYGWNVKEGTHCFGTDSCTDETPDGEPLLDPVVEYPHANAAVSGVTVIGGYVYRGSSIPELAGDYVFGDWQTEGELFAASPNGDGSWPARVLDIVEEDGEKLAQLLSFGRDNEGELYALGVTADGEGAVHRLRSPDRS